MLKAHAFSSIPVLSSLPTQNILFFNQKAYLEPDIKKELKKLNDDSWNNIEDYLEPVGPQRVTIVHLAAYAGRRDILERGAQLYADKSTVFKNRTNGESTDPMLATDKFGRCALHYAAFEGHDGVVSWILDKWGSDHSIPHPQVRILQYYFRRSSSVTLHQC